MKPHPRLALALAALALPSSVLAQCELQVVAADTAPGDEFGSKIVMSGGTTLIGAYEHDLLLQDGGAVYVWERQEATWVETRKLTPTNGKPGDFFGFGMGMDGDRAVISSFGWRNERGKATVFERQNGVWSQTAQLKAADGEAGDWIGIRCDLQGERAILGAPNDDDQGTDAGAAYVFEKIGDAWVEVAKLLPSNGRAGSMFGFDVSIHGDTALVGSWRHARAGRETGAAYVFELRNGAWVQTADLRPAGIDANDQFGIGVSLSGTRALIGARQDDEGTLVDSGCAYIFEQVSGQWVETAKLLASRARTEDEFGNNVILDGDRALIGAYQANNLKGRAYLYELRDGQWVETQALRAAQRESGALYGYDVAVSGDHLAVGAFLSSTVGARGGAAYFYLAPEVGLVASSESLGAGETLTLSNCGGRPGDPLLLVLTAVDGQPCFDPLGPVEHFDAGGSWSLSITPETDLGPLDVELTLYSRGAHGVVESNPVQLHLR